MATHVRAPFAPTRRTCDSCTRAPTCGRARGPCDARWHVVAMADRMHVCTCGDVHLQMVGRCHHHETIHANKQDCTRKREQRTGATTVRGHETCNKQEWERDEEWNESAAMAWQISCRMQCNARVGCAESSMVASSVQKQVWPGSSLSLRNEWHSNVQCTPHNNFAWMDEPSTQADGQRTWGLVTIKVFSLPMDDFPTDKAGKQASV